MITQGWYVYQLTGLWNDAEAVVEQNATIAEPVRAAQKAVENALQEAANGRLTYIEYVAARSALIGALAAMEGV